ncbi:MAG: methionyl-tRNA formyltransferase [Desulfobulbus sp.]|jgi:methionyl-tRNA formyltransferase
MSDPLRIVFMGTPDFAAASLQALLDGPDRVVAVVCQPDRPRGRSRTPAPPPVKTLAEAHALPVLQPESVRTTEFLDALRSHEPDLLAVAAYGRILPPPLLSLAPLGAINVHASLLPRLRGAAPIQWAIINGDSETGITIMQMNEGMDTGDILLTETVPIGPEETAGELFARLAPLGGATLLRAIDGLKAGRLAPQPQDHGAATMAPMLNKAMGRIDWSLPAERIHCLIRGLDPWPSAYGSLAGKRCLFFRPELVARTTDAPPGTICQADAQGLLVATGNGCLRIREIQPEGKKRMPVADWLRGAPPVAGTGIQ